MYTTGFSSEIFRNKAFGSHNIQSSIRIFMGGTIDLNNSIISTKNPENNAEYGGFCIITSYFLKYKKLYFSTEIGTDLNFGSKFSLGYSF
ncbi:hypothetical protein [Pedobacter alpinus]|uniref:Uncharacterized protein n=1 Tax=Pedobacter alpinus TaxID=1590643 RepID=A0ABW5TZG2_9SPHI